MEHRLLVAKDPLFWIFRGRKIQSFLSQNVDGNMIFIEYWKVLVLNFSGMENTIFFEAKSWWKDDIYWFLKRFCFELFHDGKCGLSWGKKLMERWYLLITERFIFWATDKFLFWAFRWWKIRYFFSQKVYVKVIFTWSFWAFHDIPGPVKYGFSCSVFIRKCLHLVQQH